MTGARHLEGIGFSTPRIIAAERDVGLVLVEDFGDDTFTRLLAAGADERSLYELAVDMLIALHRLPVSRTTGIDVPAYDDERLLTEAHLLTQWYAPTVLGRMLDDDAVREYEALWRA